MAKTSERAECRALPLMEHLTRVGKRAYESCVENGGLRPRHVVALKLLSEHGPQSQQALAEALRLDPSNVVGLLNELEARGLVIRRRDPQDRRRHTVELGPAGEKELAAAYRQLALVEDTMLGRLTPAERHQLYELLARAVDGEPNACCAADEAT